MVADFSGFSKLFREQIEDNFCSELSAIDEALEARGFYEGELPWPEPYPADVVRALFVQLYQQAGWSVTVAAKGKSGERITIQPPAGLGLISMLRPAGGVRRVWYGDACSGCGRGVLVCQQCRTEHPVDALREMLEEKIDETLRGWLQDGLVPAAAQERIHAGLQDLARLSHQLGRASGAEPPVCRPSSPSKL